MMQKSKNNEYIKLLIVILVLFAIIGVFIIYLSIPLLSSTSVVLATQPVDPFDLVRGQYIVIRYEISSIPAIEGAETGDDIYVILSKDSQGISRYESASLEKPSKDNVFILGEITHIGNENMNVKYGIEQYFFERGATFDTSNLTVEAKLSNSGGARISRLLNEGKSIEIKYRNKTLTS